MNYFRLSSIPICILIIVIHLNMLSVTSKLVSIQKGDPNKWREYGENANFLAFNRIYAVTVNEELLNGDRSYSGQCDRINPWNRQWAAYYSGYPNTCRGSLHYCWFKAKTEKRKAIEAEIDDVRRLQNIPYSYSFTDYIQNEERKLESKLEHAGNDCYCLCERYYNYENNPRGDLIDSICYDPVSVDDGYVATGARFKNHDNIVYLELQQGILSGGRIDPNTLTWKTFDRCNLIKKVVYNFRYDGTYDGLEIILEDMTLPENAVVTGITFGQSLRGRYVNDNGDLDDNVDDIVKESQCSGSVSELTTGSTSYLAPTSLIGQNNELSKSCQHKIIFRGSDEGTDHVEHVVPYIDLQETVTDQNAPKPLRGIGWYYRSHPGYGGFLALKIFE